MEKNEKEFWDLQAVFFIMDKQFMRTISVLEKLSDTYIGYSFKEDNTGWSVNPISIGRTNCELQIKDGTYELTKDKSEALNFCSLTTLKKG